MHSDGTFSAASSGSLHNVADECWAVDQDQFGSEQMPEDERDFVAACLDLDDNGFFDDIFAVVFDDDKDAK